MSLDVIVDLLTSVFLILGAFLSLAAGSVSSVPRRHRAYACDDPSRRFWA
jgi:hypothetical protein